MTHHDLIAGSVEAMKERGFKSLREDLAYQEMLHQSQQANATMVGTQSIDSMNPPHYRASKIEPIEVIEDWGLGFCLGNVLKYLARHRHKGTALEDLRKARWYLDRQIAAMEKK